MSLHFCLKKCQSLDDLAKINDAARVLILTAAFPVLVIVNLIENWGKKVDENGDLGLLLCDVITAAVISDGTCHEYFSLKWISDNSESNNNVESRGTIHWKSSSEVNSILLLAEGRGKSWLPFFLLHPCEFLNFHFKMIFFVKNSISGVVILTNFKEKKESDAIFSFPTL